MKFFAAVPFVALLATQSLASAFHETDAIAARGLDAEFDDFSGLEARQNANDPSDQQLIEEQANRLAGGGGNDDGARRQGGNNNQRNILNALLNALFNSNPQRSRILLRNQIQPALANDGQGANVEAGQVRSLTSTNNFINFCATQRTALTNGLQIRAGSCNPTPMGRIIATDKFVSSKFEFPKNTDTIPATRTFTIRMSIRNMVTGNFVNPQTNYYAAPCQVDGSGTVIGHSHVVIERMTSLAQTAPTNPNVFAFFKGLNGRAQNGVLTAEVTGGLAAGVYRMGSINACANHQPVLGAVAQHGIFDDVVYFTVQ